MPFLDIVARARASSGPTSALPYLPSALPAIWTIIGGAVPQVSFSRDASFSSRDARLRSRSIRDRRHRATVYVNGSKVPLSPAGEVALPVGAQAVRVTHPEYHDFVRFIDVPFGKTTDVAVDMQQYPIIRHDLLGKPIHRDRIDYVDPPVWRRWYVVGPAAVGLAIVTAVVVGYAVHDFPAGDCHKLGGGPC
jgi:hypothetical protein